ncbi:MAG TPA: bifunctional metallophosphatase/5'-nucleotidase [Candidatus Competibacteraceae bacterium]|nr:bifunctional metallophosphatase/5'-nucleotidase [Candidatus Competibacteraceae bacterium]
MKWQRWARGLVLSMMALGMACTAPTVTIKIIALNDFHGNLESPGPFNGRSSGGIDVLASYVAELKRRNPHHLVVSAGDLIGATPLLSASFHDEPTIETMNRLGLEFNALGNHEFDKGQEELRRMQKGGCHPTDPNTCKGALVGLPVPFEGAKFKFLAANVIEAATQKPIFPPYVIKQFNGVRLAVIGMTLKDTPTIVIPSGVAGLQFTDEAATVNALIPSLRARGVKGIIVLLHQGGAQLTPPNPPDINGCVGGLDNPDGTPSPIKQIVSHLDNAVDLVISGHTHQAYVCRLPTASGREILVTSANAQGRVLTDIELTLDTGTGKVLTAVARNLVVDRTSGPGLSPNLTIQAIVNAYGNLVKPIANQVIGAITQEVSTLKDAACEMPAGELIADAHLQATRPPTLGGAQLALMNPGGVRRPGFVYALPSDNKRPGEITYSEAFTVQPFGNSLVTLTLTAWQLKALLEQQFAGCLGKTVNRILLPSAGFQFAWDLTQPPCERIRQIMLRTGNDLDILVQDGTVLNPHRTYRITVNSFLATGGDGFTVLNDGTERLGGAQDIDALIAYFAAFKPPAPAYNPIASTRDKPRIRRLDASTSSCP